MQRGTRTTPALCSHPASVPYRARGERRVERPRRRHWSSLGAVRRGGWEAVADFRERAYGDGLHPQGGHQIWCRGPVQSKVEGAAGARKRKEGGCHNGLSLILLAKSKIKLMGSRMGLPARSVMTTGSKFVNFTNLNSKFYTSRNFLTYFSLVAS
ncbi:unnamed protein product [Urochloa humidicola]